MEAWAVPCEDEEWRGPGFSLAGDKREGLVYRAAFQSATADLRGRHEPPTTLAKHRPGK